MKKDATVTQNIILTLLILIIVSLLVFVGFFRLSIFKFSNHLYPVREGMQVK